MRTVLRAGALPAPAHRRAGLDPARARDVLDRTWPTWCTLVLIVASTYKWRQRDPTEAVSGSPDLSILVEVACYGAVALFLFTRFARRPRVLRPSAPMVLLCAYTVLLVLSVSYSPYPSYAVVRGVQALVVVALALAVAVHASRVQLRALVRGFVVLVLLSIGYGVVVPSVPVSNLQVGRFTWLSIHPTVSSVLTATAVVLLVWSFVAAPARGDRPWPRSWVVAALAITSGALVASQTRASVLGAVAGVLVVVVVGQRGRARVLVVGSAALVTGLLAVAASSQLAAFVVRGEDPAKLATLNSRTDLWGVALEALAQRPLFGYGLGAPRGIFYDDTGLGGSHNAVVNVGVETGLLGLAVWGLLQLAAPLALRWAPPSPAARAADEAPLIAGLLAAFAVVGIFYDGAGGVANPVSLWAAVLVGWVTARQRLAREETG